MQDLSTGAMRMLEGIDAFKELVPTKPFEPFAHLEELKHNLQEAKDRAIPNRDHQGPLFEIGEVLDIRGGKFRVHAITENRLYLDSLPS